MMQRIRAVLDKLNLLAQRKADRTVIDIDLMLDYTRMIYADLLELRSTLAAREDAHPDEPTLDELTAAMARKEPVAAAPAAVRQQPVSVPLPLPPSAGRDIRHTIDLNEKYLFLSELFRNDVHAYEDAMKAINSFHTEHEAMQWLGAKQWPANDGAAAAFRAALKRFYMGA